MCSFGARLYFPHYVDDANLAKFIRVNGVGKFSLGEARYRYYEDEQKYPQISDKYYYHVDIKSAEFAPNKSYELRLLKGFGDDSRIVRNEIKLNFKTGDRKPFVQFSDMKKFVPKNANIAIKSSNLNEISISVSKISDENFRYLRVRDKAVIRLCLTKEKWIQRKDYKFFTCPACRATLRVPKGRGTVKIVCRKCGSSFIGKT